MSINDEELLETIFPKQDTRYKWDSDGVICCCYMVTRLRITSMESLKAQLKMVDASVRANKEKT